MKEYPTPWQRKMMWAALTACFVVVLVVIVAAVIWAGASIISFLQPILIPVAIAAILTYLLDPLVTKMSRGTLTRTKAIALLFAIAFFALSGLTAWLVPTISVQSANFARQIPSYTERARDYIVDLIYRFDQTFGLLGAGQTEIRVEKSYQFPDRSGAISFSSPTGDGVVRPHRRNRLRPPLK